jgi:hypothetical protein
MRIEYGVLDTSSRIKVTAFTQLVPINYTLPERDPPGFIFYSSVNALMFREDVNII